MHLPAAEAMAATAGYGPMMAAAAAAAEAGAEATKGMAAAAGRSAEPAATLAAGPDPGAMAVGFGLRAVATALPK